MRRKALDMVYEMAKADPRVFFIGSDLGFGTLKDFQREIPGRFFMEGINEAHAIGMAAGLALEGKIVYVNTIATFLSRRCYEQVALDLCLHNLPVRLIGNGGGLVYAPLGPTHLAIEDLAIFRALPNMTILAPADADEIERLMPQTRDLPGPVYIRLAKGFDPIVSRPDMPCVLGKGLAMRRGQDALAVTTGITLKLALDAAETLAAKGVSLGVLHLPTVKPLDTHLLLEMASSAKAVLTVEEHVLNGGLGSAVIETLAEAGMADGKRFKRLGIPDVFPDKYGTQDGLMARYGITSAAIVDTLTSFLNI
jgi:transketolase